MIYLGVYESIVTLFYFECNCGYCLAFCIEFVFIKYIMKGGKINMINCDVVIIDSGLDRKGDSDSFGICISKNDAGFWLHGDLSDEIGHGTIIYSIICKQIVPSRVYMIKLSGYQANYDDSLIIAALEYIKQHIKCKIINISLGIKAGENITRLRDICAEISAMGIVIVSAFDNEGCYSYPAAFDCVIGVDNKNNFAHNTQFDFVENSPINILAKGSVQRIKTQEGKTLIVGGSSIACAYITSILAGKITDNWNIQIALSYLKSESRYIYSSCVSKNDFGGRLFEIMNAVVFPFAKEAHAFLRFSDLLKFNILRYYDIRPSGKVGRKLNSYYEDAGPGKIMDVEQIDFTGIDTIILGHLDELNAVMKRNYKTELIKKAIAAKVNIYSFDPLYSYIDILHDNDIRYYFPSVTENDVPQNTFGKLYKVFKPVVGIFGTSSQQGKFSLQLELKKQLELNEYNVGTIGTEPHSLLFNFDNVFPMGYNSTVYIQNNEIILYLNNIINNMCLQGKEIILAASQAQSVPYYCNNLLEYPTMQYHFALGVKPDAIILCINYYDEVAYIKNTMYALMGLTDADIIAFVIYPITYSEDWNGLYGNSKHKITIDEFKCKVELLMQEFHIPVYMLGDKMHMSKLCQDVIDYF